MYILLDFGPNSSVAGEDTRSGICLFLENNLGLGDFWWLLGLLQLSPLLPLLVLYRYYTVLLLSDIFKPLKTVFNSSDCAN